MTSLSHAHDHVTNNENNKKYQFADFVVSVREKIELEKYIATRENKLSLFNVKWKVWITVSVALLCQSLYLVTL